MNYDTLLNIVRARRIEREQRVLEAQDLPPLRYMLEVYEPDCKPGSRRVCAASFETSTPFQNVAVGDVLNPAFWQDTCSDTLTPLRVVRIEHIIWQHGAHEPAHKTCIWTERAKE